MPSRGLLALIMLMCCMQLTTSQIRVSETIQTSKIVQSDSNKLYFVDFWATWCAPCISAKTYLTTLQKQHPSDFYIVSLSEESPDVVKRFLERRPTDLAIAIDYDKETFRKYKIQSLPQGILFNANGEALWQGHPADFNSSIINRFMDRSKQRISVNDFVKVKAYEKVSGAKTIYKPGEDFELLESKRTSGYLQINNYTDYIAYEGSLKSILAYLIDAYDGQIQIDPAIGDEFYKLHIRRGTRKSKNLLKHVLKALKLKMQDRMTSGEVVILELKEPAFWDTGQINWGVGNPKYLIDDNQIQGDNVSFYEIKYQLSNLLEMPVITATAESSTNHDWQIHYRYFQLMKNDLLDNYGIEASKKTGEYPLYIIQKKTP